MTKLDTTTSKQRTLYLGCVPFKNKQTNGKKERMVTLTTTFQWDVRVSFPNLTSLATDIPTGGIIETDQNCVLTRAFK